MKRSALSLFLILTLLTWGLLPAVVAADPSADSLAASSTDEDDYAPNRVLVMYKEGAVDTKTTDSSSKKKSPSAEVSRHKARSFGQSAASIGDEDIAQAEDTLDGQVQILNSSLEEDYSIEDTLVFDSGKKDPDKVVSIISSPSMDTGDLIESLKDNDQIKIVEPDYRVRVSEVPDWDDPYFKEMHHLTAENSIHADTIWESASYMQTAEGGSSEPVIVAVVDTGVDYSHPDLKNRMWTKPAGKAFSAFSGKCGYDFVHHDADPMDENGHGTHCAGIIAGQANNGVGMTGVAGISDKVKIMAIRVLDENGSGSMSYFLAGLKYLISLRKAGANVCAMNCSFGANGSSVLYGEILTEAGEAGILSFIAAGNNAQDNDLVPITPSNGATSYRVTVAASDEHGNLASYSNYGEKNVDIVAPGSNILSTVSSNIYMPYLYDAGRLRGFEDENGKEHKGNTLYYGEFEGAAIERVTNIQGQEVDSVQPVTGTDYEGNPINSPEDPGHKAGEFGESRMLINRVSGSNGNAVLELRNEKEAVFPVGNNKTSLCWKITGAKQGDVYILYFPYKKEAGDNKSSYVNFAYRAHTEIGSGSRGYLHIGDVRVNGRDESGKVDWGTVNTDGYGSSRAAINPIDNSIWRASPISTALYPFKETNQALDYGLGLVYEVKKSGDCYFDISSLAISKSDADPSSFGKYNVYSGTSMATPVVTGAAALIASLYPGISPLELKNTLLSAIRDGYDGWCSSGGIIDLAAYKVPTGEGRPAISDVTADFEEGTVCLHGSGFGPVPVVSIFNNLTQRSETIPVNDIRLEDGTILIRHAGQPTGEDDQDSHGIIGSDISFTVKNTVNNLTGKRSAYVVKGLALYQDGYDFVRTNKNKAFSDGSMPESLTYIKGADDLLLHDAGERFYRVVGDKEKGQWHLKQMGTDTKEALKQHVRKILSDESRKDSLWHSGVPLDEKSLDYFVVSMVSEPVYMGGTIYQLVRADLGHTSSILLMALNLDDLTWTVCTDSLEGIGKQPEDLDWFDVSTATLAGYKGRLYLFGILKRTAEENGIEDDYTENDVQTAVFSCDPLEEEINWVKESAALPAPRIRGVSINQGGDLYYVLSSRSPEEVDYHVYRFDGTEWSIAGTLPQALYLREIGGQETTDGDYTVTCPTYLGIPCAVGIDDQGILFSGMSFHGAGDTFRFNTSTGKIQPLGFTLWQTNNDLDTDGTVAGGKLWAQYRDDVSDQVIAKTFDIKNDYVKLTRIINGQGEGQEKELGQGRVIGCGSYSRGDAARVAILPGENSYIYEAKAIGTGSEFSLDKIKGDIEAGIKARQEKVTFDYSSQTDGQLSVTFGKISSKIKGPGTLKKKAGTYQAGDLGFQTDGTIHDVKLEADQSGYAIVNKDGSITFTETGAGKEVTVTATAKDNSSLKATCKVTIETAADPAGENSGNKGESGNSDKKYADVNRITPSDATIDQKAAIDKTLSIDKTSMATTANLQKKTLRIKWKKVKGAVNYRLSYRKAGSKVWTGVWSKGKTEITIKKLKKNGLYQYRLQAVKKTGTTWKKSPWTKTSYLLYNSSSQKVKAGRKSLTVTVSKKKGVTGYQAAWSLKKNMSGKKTRKLKGAGKTRIPVKGLESGKIYYVQAMPYKTYKGKTYLGLPTKTSKVRVN